MKSIKLYDSSFIMCGPSAGTGSTKKAPKYMEWYTGKDYRDISVFTDSQLNKVTESNSKYNIAWIIESRAIRPDVYAQIVNPLVYNSFDFIITHDEELIKINPEIFIFTPLCGHWIKEEDCKIHDKSKFLSIISSGKRQSPGHILRHKVIDKYIDSIDGLFGNGYQFIEDKIIGLKDYMFHIVIENVKLNFWFTEKLIDSFVTGCIPIYYGTPDIENFFNLDGMIIVDKLEDFDIIKTLNRDYYISKLDAIRDNFQRAKEFKFPEDFMYKHLLGNLV